MDYSSQFAEVYAAHYGRAVRTARYRGCGDSAEDVVQTVFLELWRRFPQYADQDRAVVWGALVWGFLNNRTFKHRRGTARRPEVLVEVLPERSAGVPVDEVVELRERLSDVVRSIGELPDRSRLAVVFSASGVPVDEIADRLELSRRQVTRTLHATRQQLRAVA